MPHALICHAPGDVDALLRVHEALRRAGVPDVYGTPEHSEESLVAQLSSAFCVILLVSAESQRSRKVRELVEEARNLGITVFALRVDTSRPANWLKADPATVPDLELDREGDLDRFVERVRQRYRRRCPVISVMNLKGGVGKTTVSAQVFGAWQAETRGRVLLIDFDPQYNLTQFFFSMAQADRFALEDRSVISLFERSRLHFQDIPSPAEDWNRLATDPFEPAPREAIIHPILPADEPGWLDLVSGQFEISKYAFASDPEALQALRRHFLRCVEQFRAAYDLIVFDTNPNATFLTLCAMEAADLILAPIHADEFSLRGIKLLNSLVTTQVPAGHTPALRVLFNAVGRSEQSEFEADARAGAFDARVGFALSKALLHSALPRSNFFQVQANPDPEEPPHHRLLIHHGRGGGLKVARERLRAVVLELQSALADASTPD